MVRPRSQADLRLAAQAKGCLHPDQSIGSLADVMDCAGICTALTNFTSLTFVQQVLGLLGAPCPEWQSRVTESHSSDSSRQPQNSRWHGIFTW